MRHPRRVGDQIAVVRRKIAQFVTESARQVGQRHKVVHLAQFLDPIVVATLGGGDHLAVRERTRHDGEQTLMHLDDDPRRLHREHIGNATGKHDLIAKPLLSENHQRFARKRLRFP